jgi:hypothetical protein
MFLYGGLIQSRISNETTETILERAADLLAFKKVRFHRAHNCTSRPNASRDCSDRRASEQPVSAHVCEQRCHAHPCM